MAFASGMLAGDPCKLTRRELCPSSGSCCVPGSNSGSKHLQWRHLSPVCNSRGLAGKLCSWTTECSLRGDRVYGFAISRRKGSGRHVDGFGGAGFSTSDKGFLDVTGVPKADAHFPCSAAAGGSDSFLPETAAESHSFEATGNQLVLKVIRRVLPLVAIGVGILIGGHSVSAEVAGDASLSASGGASGGLTSFLQGREVLASAWTGLVAGGLHTLTGPDHLAALAPLCIGRSGLQCAAVGALWGCGHDAGQIIFGLIFLMLKDKLHIELIRTWSARVVGVTLMVIGAMGLKEAQEIPAFSAVVATDGQSDSSSGELLTEGKKSVGFTTFGTGIVYGLQPDALLMILPALALPSRMSGAAFLSMFLLGTVVAMGSYTAFIGTCSEALRKRIPWITRRLTEASSMIAVGLGLAILLGEVFGINIF